MNQKLKRGKNTCGLPKISTAKSSPTMQKTTEMLLNLIRVDLRIRKEMKYSCIHAVFTVYHQTLPQVQPNKQAQAPACVQTPVVCRSARRQCAVFLFFSCISICGNELWCNLSTARCASACPSRRPRDCKITAKSRFNQPGGIAE